MTFPMMSQINPVDKSANRSDLGLTFLPPIFVLATLPAALGSHLLLVVFVFYSQSGAFLEMSQIYLYDIHVCTPI